MSLHFTKVSLPGAEGEPAQELEVSRFAGIGSQDLARRALVWAKAKGLVTITDDQLVFSSDNVIIATVGTSISFNSNGIQWLFNQIPENFRLTTVPETIALNQAMRESFSIENLQTNNYALESIDPSNTKGFSTKVFDGRVKINNPSLIPVVDDSDTI